MQQRRWWCWRAWWALCVDSCGGGHDRTGRSSRCWLSYMLGSQNTSTAMFSRPLPPPSDEVEDKDRTYCSRFDAASLYSHRRAVMIGLSVEFALLSLLDSVTSATRGERVAIPKLVGDSRVALTCLRKKSGPQPQQLTLLATSEKWRRTCQ
jgi:hypothetical protein